MIANSTLSIHWTNESAVREREKKERVRNVVVYIVEAAKTRSS